MTRIETKPCCLKAEESMQHAEFDNRMNLIDQRLSAADAPYPSAPSLHGSS
jgi:hypothetical protein